MVKRKATSPHRVRKPKHTRVSPRRSSLAVKRKHSAEEERPAKRVHFADTDDELSKDLPKHRPKRTSKKVPAVTIPRVVKEPKPATRTQPQRVVKKILQGKQSDLCIDAPRAVAKRKRVPSPQTLTTVVTEATTEVPKAKRPRGRPRKEPKKPRVEPVAVRDNTGKSSKNDSHNENGSHQKQAVEVLMTARPDNDILSPGTSATIPRVEVPAGESLAKEQSQSTGIHLENGPISLVTQKDPTPLPSLTQNTPAPATQRLDSFRQMQAVSTTVPVSAAEESRIWSEEHVLPTDDPCLTLALRHLELGISYWRVVDLVEEIRLSEGILHKRSGAGYEWERRYEKRLDIE